MGPGRDSGPPEEGGPRVGSGGCCSGEVEGGTWGQLETEDEVRTIPRVEEELERKRLGRTGRVLQQVQWGGGGGMWSRGLGRAARPYAARSPRVWSGDGASGSGGCPAASVQSPTPGYKLGLVSPRPRPSGWRRAGAGVRAPERRARARRGPGLIAPPRPRPAHAGRGPRDRPGCKQCGQLTRPSAPSSRL